MKTYLVLSSTFVILFLFALFLFIQGNNQFGLIVMVVTWGLVFAYKRSSFYPNSAKSLPRNRLYEVLKKGRKNGKFTFIVADNPGSGILGKKKVLVRETNILTSSFRINDKGQLEELGPVIK